MTDYYKGAILKVKCGKEEGTAYLIGNNLALTAYHVVREHDTNSSEIILHNDKYPALSAKINVLINDDWKIRDVAILDILNSYEHVDYIKMAVSKDIPISTPWYTRGYLITKQGDGLNFIPNEKMFISDSYESFTDDRVNYDLDLSLNNVWSSYAGVSGSPILIDGYSFGVIITECLQRGEARELSGLSTRKFSDLLNTLDVDVTHLELGNPNKKIDLSAIDSYDYIEVGDIRNLSDKLTDVCKDISSFRVKGYIRDAVNSSTELSMFPTKDVNALKYRIFQSCQSKLLDFVEDGLNEELSIHEVKSMLNAFVEDAYSVLSERSLDYVYPINNRDSIRNAVLSLIDDCYFSFDEKCLYEED